MENNLASYIYRSIDRMADITPHMENNLNRLFDLWDAKNITVEKFREKYGFPKDAGIFMLLPFMTEYATDPEYTNYGKEENVFKLGK